MSMQEILDTVDGALKDPIIGLAAATLALANGDGLIRADFTHVAWALAGRLSDTRAPNVMLRPRSWQPITKRNDVGHRDAEASIDIGYEYFGTEAEHIQKNVTIVATAIAQVVDALLAYSDANDGTIIDVLDPVLFQFGQFEGPTSNGLLATLTLIERSTL